jgi:hypothetical protein
MKRISILCLVMGLFVIVTSASHGQLIIGGSTNNGNLDRTYAQEIVPGFFLPKPQVWQNDGTRVITGPYEDEMSSEPWAGPAPTPVTTDGNLNPPHPDGCGGPDCAVFFKAFSGNVANGAATGHLFQDNPATPGLMYTLTGWAGAEANAMMAGAELAVEFLDGGGGVIGGTVLDLMPTLFIDNGEPFDYKEYTVSGTAPAGSALVRARVSMIGGTPNPAGGGQAFVVDDFTLTAVPEPATFALVGVGLLTVTALRRRRS